MKLFLIIEINSVSLRTAIQNFDNSWDQVFLSTSEVPTDSILESLYKRRTRVSSTRAGVCGSLFSPKCFVVFGHAPSSAHQTHVTRGPRPSACPSSRKFHTRNEWIETGVLVKTRKGRNVRDERKQRDCEQWKANGQCTKEMLADSATMTAETVLEYADLFTITLRDDNVPDSSYWRSWYRSWLRWSIHNYFSRRQCVGFELLVLMIPFVTMRIYFVSVFDSKRRCSALRYEMGWNSTVYDQHPTW